jgi:hypothetical protein
MEKGSKHRLDGAVATVDRNQIDLVPSEIEKGRGHTGRCLDFMVDCLRMTREDPSDRPKAFAIPPAPGIAEHPNPHPTAGLELRKQRPG